MTAFWDSVERDLEELNRHATATLQRTTPPPDGLPPAGSWIRAVQLDLDAPGRRRRAPGTTS